MFAAALAERPAWSCGLPAGTQHPPSTRAGAAVLARWVKRPCGGAGRLKGASCEHRAGPDLLTGASFIRDTRMEPGVAPPLAME